MAAAPQYASFEPSVNTDAAYRKAVNSGTGQGTYRQYLQRLANQGGLAGQEANALLQVVGDDFGINEGFVNDPYAFTGKDTGRIAVPSYDNPSTPYGYGPQSIQRLNDIYKQGFYGRYNEGESLNVGGGGGSGSDAGADRAYLDTQEGQLRSLLESALRTKTQGLQQIDDDFNKESGRTNERKAAAEAGFATQREDTTRDKMGAIEGVNTNARTLSDSVRRMLGMASGSQSSAYQLAAPNAIARDTTVKRSNVVDTFGRNLRDVDTAEKSTMDDFTKYLEDLQAQRNEKRRGLEEGVLQQEQGIYNNLAEIGRQRALLDGGGYNRVREAMAPAAAEISSRQAQLDGLFDRFRTPYQTRDVQVAKPELAAYTTDRTVLGAGGGGGGQAGDVSPYYEFARRKFRQEA